jgi:tRNA (guanine-N7-)-methyltransferase
MQPKNLKAPFYFKQRKTVLENGILYVPIHYSEYQELKFELSHFFDNEHPICLEYCSGNGHWIIEQAKKNPNKNFIAVEKKFSRVRKIWSKRENNGLKNLLIVSGFAMEFTTYFLQKEQVEKIWIHFPDPYPKQRHQKHRLVHSEFAWQMQRVLQPTKEVIIVTDDHDYGHACLETMTENGFDSFYKDPPFKKDVPYDFSQFLNFWQREGKSIYHFKFQKRVI